MSLGNLSLGRTLTTHNHPTRYWETFIIDGINLIATSHGETLEESQEIARVLCAAPELLSVCCVVKDFLATLENGTAEDDPLRDIRLRVHKRLHDALDAALAKAEGRA